ncbi:AMIN-like domain-containing (lipo)protein [Aquipuribacter hungaricus]|uniref:AMIN-like domain-containing protein n=1 Tax=Aquipuribacter hungaricus TaxID=545624 RepID=A0ABV7WGV2_9MICO
MKTAVSRTVAVLALLLPALLVPATAGAAASCGTGWGSLPKTSAATVSPSSAPGDLVALRSGRHACFDRLVVDVDGSTQGYSVRYVDQVRSDGSGTVVPTAGGARLEVVVGAPAYDDEGMATFVPPTGQRLLDVGGYATFREVTWAGSFEGQSTAGLGVRARLPFRVLALDGPGTSSRVVVDVAHRW